MAAILSRPQCVNNKENVDGLHHCPTIYDRIFAKSIKKPIAYLVGGDIYLSLL